MAKDMEIRLPSASPLALQIMPQTRIAPTPSGYLHAGNAINFLITAEVARECGASIRLRIDDLDVERMRPQYIDDIFASLRWLGIDWSFGPRDRQEHDRAWSQQLRLGRYHEALSLLKEQGDLYACTCSRAMQKQLRCECRSKQLDFHSPEAVWRLHLPVDALVQLMPLFGEPRWLSPAQHMPDPVVRQRIGLGGRPAYQIASLVDDEEHGITHIVRGVDLLPSTLCQLYLADRLGIAGFQQVRFVHHPLITDAQGGKLSKSEGASSLRAMRKAGQTADALRERAVAMLDALRAEADQGSIP